MLLRHFRHGLRYIRASWQRWSPERDRVYHDSLFHQQHINPFRFSYPGNITIRRFADLTAPFVDDARHVLDLGCGTGEITCELARRFPQTSFKGIDHSQSGVTRAQSHAETLALRNVSFRVANVEQFEPEKPVDLVLMFDSFHHLTKPQSFLDRIGQLTSRFLLIEPRGDWKGSWNKELDFDWLVQDLDKIRAHLAYATGEPLTTIASREHHGGEREEPVEHRYSVEDFEHFFSGYNLEVRGTIAGLESYPPGPEHESPSRERFGKLAYELYTEVDDLLRQRDLDLLAKHLVIHAHPGDQTARAIKTQRASRRIVPSNPGKGILWTDAIRGPYDVRYLSYDGPTEAPPLHTLMARVRLKNESWRRWSSGSNEGPDFLSYHWLDRHGTLMLLDGIRTALPRTVLSGDELDVALKVTTPAAPGRYLLAVDMVRESTTWFSDAGSPPLLIAIRIR